MLGRMVSCKNATRHKAESSTARHCCNNFCFLGYVSSYSLHSVPKASLLMVQWRLLLRQCAERKQFKIHQQMHCLHTLRLEKAKTLQHCLQSIQSAPASAAHNLQVFLAWDQGPVLWCEDEGGQAGLKQETASLEYIALKISCGAVCCLTGEAAFKLDSLS